MSCKEEIGDGDDSHQHHAHRGGEREIGGTADLEHDGLWQQQFFGAAEDLRRDVIADRQYESEEGPYGDTRQAQGQRNSCEYLERRGAEICRRAAIALTNLR